MSLKDGPPTQEKLMPAKRYKVTLTHDERQDLLALVSKGKTAAYKLTRARILLQADQGPGGPAWTDEHICQTLHVGRKTVERTREACVEIGLEAALQRKPRSRPGPIKFDGEKEAHLIALACSQPPQGRTRWTLHLLADNMVELQHFEAISHETIRQHLKKTNLSLG
jgi:Homeodomain-like domain